MIHEKKIWKYTSETFKRAVNPFWKSGESWSAKLKLSIPFLEELKNHY
jgi:hypothetical protein